MTATVHEFDKYPEGLAKLIVGCRTLAGYADVSFFNVEGVLEALKKGGLLRGDQNDICGLTYQVWDELVNMYWEAQPGIVEFTSDDEEHTDLNKERPLVRVICDSFDEAA